MALEIKVCGMTRPGNIREVAALGPDYMGFILYPHSPRYIGDTLPVEAASLPEGITPVAVSVNMGADELAAFASRSGISTLQLHGDETPDYCHILRERGLTVWKALPVSSADDFLRAGDYAGAADMLLLDTATASRGGSGLKFDWTILESYLGPLPFFLSGGIGPGDSEAIRAITHHPLLRGIDLNSRFETSQGIKNPYLLSSFIATIRQ